MSQVGTARWAIRVSGPEGTQPVCALNAEAVTLGRSSQVQVQLDDAGVSRRHAVLEPADNDQWTVRDLDSRNGTRVNGQPVSRQTLRDGDRIEIGPFEVVFGTESGLNNPAPAIDSDNVTVVEDRSASISRLTEVGRPKVDAQQLRAVQALGRDLLQLEDGAARRQRLCAFMIEPGLQGRHAAVLRVSAATTETGWAAPKIVAGPIYADEADRDFYISRSLLESVRTNREAVLATRSGLESDGAPGNQDDAAPIVELSIAPETNHASVIGCPLPAEMDTAETLDAKTAGHAHTSRADGSVDVLYAVLPDRCGTGEWLALAALAVEQFDLVERAWRARRAAEVQARTEAELARARKVQLALVPENPALPGLELALHFEPCLSVGGDYVDAVELPDGRSLLLVMDVCGKGMAAALTSSSLHTFIHAGVRSTSDPVELLNALNRYLIDTLDDSSFVTGIAVAVDPATGRCECVNVGHPPAILAPGSSNSASGGTNDPTPTLSEAKPSEASGPRYSQQGHNPPLGLLPDPLIGHEFDLAPGEVLGLYSDGLTEIIGPDGHWLGHEALAAELTAAVQDAAADAESPAPDPGDTSGPVAAGISGGAAANTSGGNSGGGGGLVAVRRALNVRLTKLQAGEPPDDDTTFLLARRA